MGHKSVLIDLIDTFCKMYQTAEFSFGHIVLSDYNLSNGSIAFCMNQRDEWMAEQLEGIYNDKSLDDFERLTAKQTAITRAHVIYAFLQFLLTIPEEVRLVTENIAHGEEHPLQGVKPETNYFYLAYKRQLEDKEDER